MKGVLVAVDREVREEALRQKFGEELKGEVEEVYVREAVDVVEHDEIARGIEEGEDRAKVAKNTGGQASQDGRDYEGRGSHKEESREESKKAGAERGSRGFESCERGGEGGAEGYKSDKAKRKESKRAARVGADNVKGRGSGSLGDEMIWSPKLSCRKSAERRGL